MICVWNLQFLVSSSYRCFRLKLVKTDRAAIAPIFQARGAISKKISGSYLQHFPKMWQYELDLWPPNLKNNRHLSLIMLINCTMLWDPGTNGSVCILPTTFSYYVTIRPWPWTSDLEKQQASLSHRADQMYQVVRSWTIGSSYKARTDGQTDGRRHTIVRPVKDERKKMSKGWAIFIHVHTLEGGMELRFSGSLIIARFILRSFLFEYSINDFASGIWYFST